MGCRFKYEQQINKVKKKEHLHDFEQANFFQSPTAKILIITEQIIFDYIKIINFCSSNDTIRELKHSPQKEHLYYIYPRKDFYPGYIKNSYTINEEEKDGNLIEQTKTLKQIPY